MTPRSAAPPATTGAPASPQQGQQLLGPQEDDPHGQDPVQGKGPAISLEEPGPVPAFPPLLPSPGLTVPVQRRQAPLGQNPLQPPLRGPASRSRKGVVKVVITDTATITG